MSEREAMRGRLFTLMDDAARLRLQIEGDCSVIRERLNTVLVESVDDLDVPVAAAQMDELVEKYARLQGLKGQIQKLERELR